MIEDFMALNEFSVEYVTSLVTLIFITNIVFIVIDLFNDLRR